MAIWKKLGSGTFSTNTISSGTFDFSGSENIYWTATYKLASSAGDPLLTVNGSSDDYSYHRSIDGGADTNNPSTNSLINNSVADITCYDQGYIFNVSGKEKLVIVSSVYSASTAAVPNRRQYGSKWSDNAVITSIQYTMGSGNFSSGEIAVYGDNGVAGSETPAVIPLISNGALFEESDTGKIYMFDGTDTWNEKT